MMYPIRYSVKDRWLKVERNGEEERIPNPNPTVAVLKGQWRPGEGEFELFRVSASVFRDMTGRIVYGGNVDPRGIQKFYVEGHIHAVIQARAGNRVREAVKRAKQTPDAMERIRAIRSGQPRVLKGVPVRRRRRSDG